jgi:glycine dehydrogenase subunit 2
MRRKTQLIFEISRPGRRASGQAPKLVSAPALPAQSLRKNPLQWPEVSELDVVRHYTNLSRRNFSIDTECYPLGSCTMKYNPRAAHVLALLPGVKNRHPLAPLTHSQGFMSMAYGLQEILKETTGMQAVALSPMAGAQGELVGVAMIKAYHTARGDKERTEMLVPDAAHGTNPASAVMCGYSVREIPTGADGDIDLAALKAAVGPKTAGIMLTNPSTLGVFDRRIKEMAAIVHQAGGLLYYDGANLNAILGKVRPGDMGFDVMHINLHKTFATPHGGGGPGAGPVAAGARLAEFLPVPRVAYNNNTYYWLTAADCPKTVGQFSAFMGNAGIIVRAYIYARLLGREGLHRVAEFAALNANYIAKRLSQAGFTLAYPERRASHEFIVTLKREAKELGMTAMDFAKRLLDYGYHAPTTYFPLLVPECLLIEPTETESKATLDGLVDASIAILNEAKTDPALVKQAPYTQPVRRLDDVKAARELDLIWRE